jgi:hypothetical protein
MHVIITGGRECKPCCKLKYLGVLKDRVEDAEGSAPLEPRTRRPQLRLVTPIRGQANEECKLSRLEEYSLPTRRSGKLAPVDRLQGAFDARQSATGDLFRNTIAGWLTAHGELLVLHRPTRAGGLKHWWFIRELDDLDQVVRRARVSDCLTVFSGSYLPYRGLADDELLAEALALVGSVDESVFGEMVLDDLMLHDSYEAGPGDEDWIDEWIQNHWSHPIAFGPYPPFLSNNPDAAIDGIVPARDGTVTIGVY